MHDGREIMQQLSQAAFQGRFVVLGIHHPVKVYVGTRGIFGPDRESPVVLIRDQDVDGSDTAIFLNCMTGHNILGILNCAD